MNIINVLTAVTYYSFTTPAVKGLTSWVSGFINLFPSIALGVIIFTLLLKLITLPLDYYSRASMRKNSLKMEQMRPQLEKLQKQYANDKNKYNQKMMALYKKNGYSMFGACLPSIITLVFFIIVLTAFNNYSTYQNIKYLYNMNTAYNNIVDEGIEDIITDDGIKYIYHDKEGRFVINDEEIKKAVDASDLPVGLKVTYNENKVSYATEGGYVTITKTVETEGENVKYSFNSDGATIDWDKFSLLTPKGGEKTYGALYDEYIRLVENDERTEEKKKEDFIKEIQQDRSAKKFRDENERFLWVANIWMPDSPFQHPVFSDYNAFNGKYKLEKYTSNPEQYANLTAKLGKEKKQVNGYLIMVVLTAATSLLSQLVMNKSQKTQLELQSVDGQGMQTQKIMMWMMPIMMGVFALMYTAAFSLYIIMSSVISLLSTLLINKIVDISFKKKLAKEEASGDIVYKKVRVAEVNDGKKDKKKNKK